MFWLFVPLSYAPIGPCFALVQNLVPAPMRSKVVGLFLLMTTVGNLVIAPQLVGDCQRCARAALRRGFAAHGLAAALAGRTLGRRALLGVQREAQSRPHPGGNSRGLDCGNGRHLNRRGPIGTIYKYVRILRSLRQSEMGMPAYPRVETEAKHLLDERPQLETDRWSEWLLHGRYADDPAYERVVRSVVARVAGPSAAGRPPFAGRYAG